MTATQKLAFYEKYIQLCHTTQVIQPNAVVEAVLSPLYPIFDLFHITKSVTLFCRNPQAQHRGQYETLIPYDKQLPCKQRHTVQLTAKTQMSAIMTVYASETAAPLSDEEQFCLDLAMRTVLVYICQIKLQELTFFDDDNYPNTKHLYHYINDTEHNHHCHGKAVIAYNFRHFSLINREYGREAGNTILRQHYTQMKVLAGSSGIVARLGGDNFICICENTNLQAIISYLTEAEIIYNHSGNTICITTSAGIFLVPNDYIISNADDIMSKAMHAYHAAQHGGHDHIVFYKEAMLANKEKTMQVQKNFTHALKNKEFHVFYQPKINILTGELYGAEALCRWIHNGNIIPPIDFIPILEQTSDICQLDFYMLDSVCQNIRQWLDSGKHVVRTSVNLSRKHVLNNTLLQNILRIIDMYQIPHNLIEIELTETTTDVEFKALKYIVDGLHEKGIVTSVDDFGMGYSSLNLIRVVPWDILKIDRMFIPTESDAENSIRNIMFRHVVNMANELGLACIAEGIETNDQLNILKKNNCIFAQGFLFDKPLPVNEFETRMDSPNYFTKEEI